MLRIVSYQPHFSVPRYIYFVEHGARMTKTIYRTLSKRRSARARGASRGAGGFTGLSIKLDLASARLRIARGRR